MFKKSFVPSKPTVTSCTVNPSSLRDAPRGVASDVTRSPRHHSDAPTSMEAPTKEESDSTRFALVYFGKDSSDVKIKWLYRGDSNAPQQIFTKGFKSRGASTNLLSHVNPIGEDWYAESGFVSTTTSKEVAASFPKHPYSEQSFLYEINFQKSGIDVKDALRPDVAQGRLHHEDWKIYAAEKEVAVPFKIHPADIKGAWEVDVFPSSGQIMESSTSGISDYEDIAFHRIIKKNFISNPHYRSPGSALVKAFKGVGFGLTAVAATLDAKSLYDAYQTSHESGNYDQFFHETARVVGGWTGAVAVGTTFAKAAAMSCAPLGPYGPPVCGFVGGMVGSVIGYTAGSKIATTSSGLAAAELDTAQIKPRQKKTVQFNLQPPANQYAPKLNAAHSLELLHNPTI